MAPPRRPAADHKISCEPILSSNSRPVICFSKFCGICRTFFPLSRPDGRFAEKGRVFCPLFVALSVGFWYNTGRGGLPASRRGLSHAQAEKASLSASGPTFGTTGGLPRRPPAEEEKRYEAEPQGALPRVPAHDPGHRSGVRRRVLFQVPQQFLHRGRVRPGGAAGQAAARPLPFHLQLHPQPAVPGAGLSAAGQGLWVPHGVLLPALRRPGAGL